MVSASQQLCNFSIDRDTCKDHSSTASTPKVCVRFKQNKKSHKIGKIEKFRTADVVDVDSDV